MNALFTPESIAHERHSSTRLVTLIHGHNASGSRDYLQAMLDGFREQEYSLCWYETKREQIGPNRWRSATMSQELRQARAVCMLPEFAQYQQRILVGHSTGAALAFTLARTIPTTNIVAYLPLIDFPRLGAVMRKKLAASVGHTDLNPDAEELAFAYDTNIDGKEFAYDKFFSDWLRWDFYRTTVDCMVPATFVAAGEDKVAPPTQVQRAAAYLGAQFILTPGSHIPTLENAANTGKLLAKVFTASA